MKDNKKRTTIGTQYLEAYPERRNIVNAIPNTNYKEVFDVYRKIINFKRYLRSYTKLKKLFGKLIYQTTKERYTFYLTQKNNEIDFFHFFNSINLGAKQPWGVTFETSLPAYHGVSLFHKGHFKNGNKKALKGIKRYLQVLANDKCRFIIAISQCTYDIQKSILDFFPKYKKPILNKTHILHPPQELLVKSLDEKPNYETVNFMYIGTEFLGKGGVEILHIFEKIKNNYKNFHLYLVGNFYRESSCTQNITLIEKEKLKAIISDNPERITYYEYLPNNELLELMRCKIHVGLLPTRGDTYGYSVLEFQAAGCPVISTDLRALAEINNTDCGWLINVDKNKFKEAYHFNSEDLNSLQNQIEKQLEPLICEILENTACIQKRAIESIERIRKEHSPALFTKRLQTIYKDILY